MKQKLINGDCIEELKKLPANSIDSIVTDPPYDLTSQKVYSKQKEINELASATKRNIEDNTCYGSLAGGFMGKKWDGTGIAFKTEIWKEALRVLKPGGHILSFGGTRTYHRMATAIEDAGFVIRDCIFWCYGSGFPKSLNIGKAIDKKQGNKRKVIRENPNKKGRKSDSKGSFVSDTLLGKGKNTGVYIDKGNSEWEGWGTALKPAVEPVVLGRKPLSEKTIVDNILKHGTGGINIDDSRVGNEERTYDLTMTSGNFETTGGGKNKKQGKVTTTGRFPANLILECICDEVVEGKAKGSPGHWSKTETKGYGDFGGGSSSYEGVGVKDDMKTIIHTNPDCPCYVLDEQSGITKGSGKPTITKAGIGAGLLGQYDGRKTMPTAKDIDVIRNIGDNGGASRYFKEIEGDRIFYTAKASKSERNNGLEGFEEAPIKGRDAGQDIRNVPYKQRTTPIKNSHPTVKPVKLMRYLIKLITPPNGTVLDPFMGSGTTGVAAKLEGFNFVGIEKEKEYIKIAEARIKNYKKENPKKKIKAKKKKAKKVKSEFWQ
jgi:site-specific DNA-methyltransferase (adenine-specific)